MPPCYIIIITFVDRDVSHGLPHIVRKISLTPAIEGSGHITLVSIAWAHNSDMWIIAHYYKDILEQFLTVPCK